MTDDFYSEDVPDELSTESLAAEVEALKAEIESVKSGAAEIAFRTSMEIAQQAQETHEPAPDLVAQTLPPRPPMPRASLEHTKALTAQALAAVSAADSGWHDVSRQVMQRIEERPEHFGQLVQSGNPVAVSNHLLALADRERASRDTRQMKLQAQTMTGATGRPPAMSNDAEEWARVVDAGANTWADRRSRG
jgi:hypothetical protein